MKEANSLAVNIHLQVQIAVLKTRKQHAEVILSSAIHEKVKFKKKHVQGNTYSENQKFKAALLGAYTAS